MSPPTLSELEGELRQDSHSRRFFDLAREYQKLGRLGEAQDICEKGLSEFPNHWQARLLLSQIYVTKGKLDDARQMVERVLLAFHDSVPANHLAADIYWALGEREKALRHYQIVDLLQPGLSGVQERLGELQLPVEPSLEPEAASTLKTAPLEPLDQLTQEAPVPAEVEAAEIPPLALPPLASEPAYRALDRPPTEINPLEPPSQEVPWADTGAPLSELDEDTASFVSVLEPADDTGSVVESVQAEPLGERLLKREPAALVTADDSSPAEPLAQASEGPPGLNTVTLAELYEKQGYPEKAVEIYQRMLLQGPENPAIHGRIHDLMTRMAGEVPEAPAVRQEDVEKAMRQKRILVLQGWLRRVREGQHV